MTREEAIKLVAALTYDNKIKLDRMLSTLLQNLEPAEPDLVTD